MADALKAIDAGAAMAQAEYKAGLAAAPYAPDKLTSPSKEPASVHTESAPASAASPVTTSTAASYGISPVNVNHANGKSPTSLQPAETSGMISDVDPEQLGSISARYGTNEGSYEFKNEVSSELATKESILKIISSQQGAVKASLGDILPTQTGTLDQEHPQHHDSARSVVEIVASGTMAAESTTITESNSAVIGPIVLDAWTVARSGGCLHQHPVIAAEEVAFAAMLGGSLQATVERRDTLVQLSHRTQAQV